MVNSLDVAAPQHSVEEIEPDIRNYTVSPLVTATYPTRPVGIPSLPVLLLALVTAAPTVSALTPTKTQFGRVLVERNQIFARQAVATAEATCACVAESAHAAGVGFAIRGERNSLAWLAISDNSTSPPPLYRSLPSRCDVPIALQLR